jgi:four helix bundle protein
MRGDELSERFLEFGVRIMKLVQALPKNFAAKHVAQQLLRSGTSAGANYEEARGAESRPDFIHKVGVAWKETREAWYWLRLIYRAQLVARTRMESLVMESDQLSRILSKSLTTARKKPPP